VEFFAFLREMTADGFFTSQIGVKYLGYVETRICSALRGVPPCRKCRKNGRWLVISGQQQDVNLYDALVMKDPAVQTIVGFAGGHTSANSGRMFITLKPLVERKISADQLIGRLPQAVSRAGRDSLHAIRPGPHHRARRNFSTHWRVRI
jgi:hypothetical protein